MLELQQLFEVHVKALRDTCERVDGGIALARFDAIERDPVELEDQRELAL